MFFPYRNMIKVVVDSSGNGSSTLFTATRECLVYFKTSDFTSNEIFGGSTITPRLRIVATHPSLGSTQYSDFWESDFVGGSRTFTTRAQCLKPGDLVTYAGSSGVILKGTLYILEH